MTDNPPEGPFSLRKTATAVSKATYRNQVVIGLQSSFHQANYSILDRVRERPSVISLDEMFSVGTFFTLQGGLRGIKQLYNTSVCNRGIPSAVNASAPAHIRLIYISFLSLFFSFF